MAGDGGGKKKMVKTDHPDCLFESGPFKMHVLPHQENEEKEKR